MEYKKNSLAFVMDKVWKFCVRQFVFQLNKQQIGYKHLQQTNKHMRLCTFYFEYYFIFEFLRFVHMPSDENICVVQNYGI